MSFAFRYFLGSLVTASMAVAAGPVWAEPTPTPPAQQAGNTPEQTQPSSGVAEIVAANASTPAQIPALLKPLLMKNPDAAVDVVAAAKANPALFEILAQTLADVQRTMKTSDPKSAEKIAAIVALAAPAFQAAYAVALAPGDGGGGGGAQAAAGGGGNGGGAAAGGGGGGSGGGGGGFGGGGFSGVGGGFSSSGGQPILTSKSVSPN